jgi:hypothetical protein
MPETEREAHIRLQRRTDELLQQHEALALDKRPFNQRSTTRTMRTFNSIRRTWPRTSSSRTIDARGGLSRPWLHGFSGGIEHSRPSSAT